MERRPMTAVQSPSRRFPRFLPLLAGAGLLAVVVGAQVGGLVPGTRPSGPVDVYLDEPLLAPPPAEQADGSTSDGSTSLGASSGTTDVSAAGAETGDGYDAAAELTRVRADVDFWAAKLQANPANIVAAVELSQSDVALARMTGDVASYVAAETAVGAALKAQPGYLPAQAARATILVSLHQFPAARDLALQVLSVSPDDPTSLGALGDSRLELGDLAGAATAYHPLAPGPAGRPPGAGRPGPPPPRARRSGGRGDRIPRARAGRRRLRVAHPGRAAGVRDG